MKGCLAFAVLVFGGCEGFVRHQAAGTTAQILVRAQPALNQESDYELAARAIPGALKTVEGFYVADAQPELREILTEGYCQYANAFVEDEWEQADFAHRLDDAAYHNARASKMYARCLNYALDQLGPKFEKDLYGPPDVAQKRIGTVGLSQRTPLMWAGLGLGGMVLHNLKNPEMLSYQPIVQAILERVIALDKAHRGEIDGTKRVPCDAGCTMRLALPHIAMGMLLAAKPTAMGGDPKRASEEFATALRITADAKHPDGKMLLARVLWAFRIGKSTDDRKLFHDQLVKVLQTDPGIWPEQRLANEVAHRKARRYLSHEKEWF
jgi:hypothetical protein